jgi:hypothetical protein
MPQLQDRKIWAARKIPVTQPEPPRKVHEAKPDPRPPAVTFVTTEHFVLQGARSSTIAESSGRANMFLAAVSGGLVALGLVATASNRDQRHRSRTPGACDLGERWPTQRPAIRMTRDGSLMCGPPRPVSAHLRARRQAVEMLVRHRLQGPATWRLSFRVSDDQRGHAEPRERRVLGSAKQGCERFGLGRERRAVNDHRAV